MKVNVTFDISPEEAVALMQGTTSAFQQEIAERMAKGVAEGMAASCIKNMSEAPSSTMNIFDWWKKS